MKYFLKVHIDGSDHNFIDRKNDIFQIEGLTFYSDLYLDWPLVDTLVEGEMVIDNYPERDEQRHRYLIYDIISVKGKSIRRQNFDTRMRTIEVKNFFNIFIFSN